MLQLTNNRDKKLLHQLGLDSHSLISVKSITSTGASANVISSVADDEVRIILAIIQ